MLLGDGMVSSELLSSRSAGRRFHWLSCRSRAAARRFAWPSSGLRISPRGRCHKAAAAIIAAVVLLELVQPQSVQVHLPRGDASSWQGHEREDCTWHRHSYTAGLRELDQHRSNFVRYFVVALLAWFSFDYFLALVMRVPANPDNTPLVLHVSSQVIVPIMGFTFAVFTERAATELKHRIDNMESYLNREAAVLTMLLPKLGLLLRCHPEHRESAFRYLESHIDRIVGRLRNGSHWSRYCVNFCCDEDPADSLIMAVQAVEENYYEREQVPFVQVSLLRGVTDLIREFTVLRAQRITAEQTTLPTFHWASLLCFGVTFALGFLWAAGGERPVRQEAPPSPRQHEEVLGQQKEAAPELTEDHMSPPSDSSDSRSSATIDSGSTTASSTATRRVFACLCCTDMQQELPLVDIQPEDAEAVDRAIRCKRLKVMWVLLVLSQFLVLEMSIDMQNPYAGQYKVDEKGVLAAVFDGPLRSKLMKAWESSCPHGGH